MPTAYDYDRQEWVHGAAARNQLRRQALDTITAFEERGNAYLTFVGADRETRIRVRQAAELARTAGYGFATDWLAGLGRETA